MDTANACFGAHPKSLPKTESVTKRQVLDLFDLPLPTCCWTPRWPTASISIRGEIRASTLVSLKTGACTEDCAYCAQSSHHAEPVPYQALMSVQEVLEAGTKGQGRRSHAPLHGRRLAQPPHRPPVRRGAGHGPRRQGVGVGSLHDLGDAGRRPGAATQGCGTGLLQPQSGHVARVLRENHHHAHLPGSAGHDPAGARGGDPRVLGRHFGHGRIARRPRRTAARTGQSPGASGIGARPRLHHPRRRIGQPPRLQRRLRAPQVYQGVSAGPVWIISRSATRTAPSSSPAQVRPLEVLLRRRYPCA